MWLVKQIEKNGISDYALLEGYKTTQRIKGIINPIEMFICTNGHKIRLKHLSENDKLCYSYIDAVNHKLNIMKLAIS